MIKTVELPQYAEQHLQLKKRFNFISGGRASTKTTTVARLFLLFAYAEKKRFLCTRQIQKSIKESSYAALQKAAYEMGMSSSFNFMRDSIICLRTKSQFIFQGLESNPTQIKSMENINHVWVEEAESVKSESFEYLIPTIRAENSDFWITWNPKYETDPVELLKERFKSEACITHVTYLDNPWLPKVLEQDRQIWEREAPDIYAHMWLGQYLTADIERVVLPYHKLTKCVGAAEVLNYTASGWGYVGLDVADGGADKPAYCVRRGSLIEVVEEMTEKNGHDIAQSIYPILVDSRAARCHYDAVGVGASIKAAFVGMKKIGKLSFFPEPFLGGASVKGAKRKYAYNIDNAGFFSNLKAQAYWNLRLRLENTIKALNGEKVDLNYCLFLPKNTHIKVLQELSQVVYDLNSADRIKVDKQPNNKASPNMADAIMMSFSRDCMNGLTAC
jgi:phage terminase large subunit